MVLDVIAVILVMIALFRGMRQGLVVALFSFVSFFIGLAAALKLSVVVAGYLQENTNVSGRWLPFLAFTVVFVAVVILVRLGAHAIQAGMKLVMLGWLNRIGGFVFYLLLYFFVYSILLFYATEMRVIKPTLITASFCYGYIEPFAPAAISLLGKAIPVFHDLFGQLENFFEGVSVKAGS